MPTVPFKVIYLNASTSVQNSSRELAGLIDPSSNFFLASFPLLSPYGFSKPASQLESQSHQTPWFCRAHILVGRHTISKEISILLTSALDQCYAEQWCRLPGKESSRPRGTVLDSGEPGSPWSEMTFELSCEQREGRTMWMSRRQRSRQKYC